MEFLTSASKFSYISTSICSRSHIYLYILVDCFIAYCLCCMAYEKTAGHIIIGQPPWPLRSLTGNHPKRLKLNPNKTHLDNCYQKRSHSPFPLAEAELPGQKQRLRPVMNTKGQEMKVRWLVYPSTVEQPLSQLKRPTTKRVTKYERQGVFRRMKCGNSSFDVLFHELRLRKVFFLGFLNFCRSFNIYRI